jgi:uncharacterized membrane protein
MECAERSCESTRFHANTLMLVYIALALVVLWLIGVVGGYVVSGLVHLILVVALILFVLQFVGGGARRTL